MRPSAKHCDALLRSPDGYAEMQSCRQSAAVLCCPTVRDRTPTSETEYAGPDRLVRPVHSALVKSFGQQLQRALREDAHVANTIGAAGFQRDHARERPS